MTPRFEANALATLKRVNNTFTQRGTEYGDTWNNCQFLKMKAVARKLRLNIPDEFFRALCTAGFVDMKYQRNEGGYKDDSLIDGIAYDSYLAQEMVELLEWIDKNGHPYDRIMNETSTRTPETASYAVSQGFEPHIGSNGVQRSTKPV